MKAEKVEKVDKQNNNWKAIETYFKKEENIVSEISFTVQVNGIYSLPEEYSRMNDATPEYLTQMKISDILFTEAKYNIRQLSEEEKKAEEDKKGKKPPEKKGKVEEPSQEEKDRIEKERLDKEEKIRKAIEGNIFN